jgi:hypothetical protein
MQREVPDPFEAETVLSPLLGKKQTQKRTRETRENGFRGRDGQPGPIAPGFIQRF